MFAHIRKSVNLSRGERGLVMAYAGLVAVAAGITIKVMSSLEGHYAIPPEPTLYDNWAIIAGGLSAGIALFLLRGWMGIPGFVGILQAILGSLMVAFLAAFIAGTLIAPIGGTVMAPLLLLSVFLSLPWLVMAWFAVAMGSHFLLLVWKRERTWGSEWTTDENIYQLSSFSKVSLYGKRLDH